MEKNSTIKISLSGIRSSLRSTSVLTSNPDVVWRAVLALALIALLVVAAAGWFVYDWAVSIEAPPPPPRPEKSIISIAEMEKVIVQYEKKSENFEALKLAPPLAPHLEGGSRQVPSSTNPPSPTDAKPILPL